MQSKLTGKQNIVTGIKNALGLGRKRGGAGAVVAALAVIAIVSCMTVSAVGEHPERNNPPGDVPEPSNGFEPTPWEKPITQEPPITHHGAMPTRLPC